MESLKSGFFLDCNNYVSFFFNSVAIFFYSYRRLTMGFAVAARRVW